LRSLKPNADIIKISGHDGVTGASPLSSIKRGGPQELGLTKLHRVLMENKLRVALILRVDGGFKSGQDVLIGALMGGESMALVRRSRAEGCVHGAVAAQITALARRCHARRST